ncbi:glycosyltransferase [candidate division KSB1 bacterium]|nr:glycosyltransferase [candidate division KSB1 bacterium]
MKNVLIVVQAFPPRGGGGVIRMTKFVKYLPEFGWHPIVLTVKNQNRLMNDESLLTEIPPSVEVHRLPTFFPDFLYQNYQRTILKAKLEASIGQSKPGGLKRLLKQAYSLFEQALVIPDNKISWIPLAITRGIRIIDQQKIDVILTSSPPHSTQIIGYFLAKHTNKPWCADYRDEWVGNPYFEPRFKFRRAIERDMESCFIHKSRCIIANTEQSRQNFVKRYTHLAHKFSTITNGFDADDFDVAQAEGRDNGAFTISYIGSISIKRNPTAFFSALSGLFQEKPELKHKIKIVFVGPFYDAHRRQLSQLGIESNIEIVGNISHRESIRYMQQTDALLLLLLPGEATDGIVPGKTYEYLRANKPVMALVPEGSVSKLVTQNNKSIVADPLDADAIKRAILQLYENRQEKFESSFPIADYDRKYLCGKLAEKLSALSENTGC